MQVLARCSQYVKSFKNEPSCGSQEQQDHRQPEQECKEQRQTWGSYPQQPS